MPLALKPAGLLARMSRRSVPLTNLAQDDRVALFPSLGHLDRTGENWHIHVHGEVFARGHLGLGKRFLLKMLQRAMKVPPEAFQTELFQRRIARFVASNVAGRRIAVRLGEQVHQLPKKSRANGHFTGAVRLAVDKLPVECWSGGAARLSYEVCGQDSGPAVATGQAFLLPVEGWSVITDIDDTLKHTQVDCKESLLVNTFLREFQPIAGMAGLLAGWQGQGAAVHYVSSSPWQLYQHLAEHLRQEGFPEGSFHLRAFRLRDHLIRRLLLFRRSGKGAVIHGLLKTFPKRRFLLLGDSGEHDPEIYGALARKFPRQVGGIFIRQIDSPKNTPHRYQRAFRGVPYDKVRLFREPGELGEAVLPGS
ncbi:MAG: App1 family protein [Pirellulaceae bacterium]|nr:App1 family protein [Pirellulaceae bacterium]